MLNGQFELRGLTVGPGTSYRLLTDTNPFTLKSSPRGDGKRAWAHGGWAGAEFAEQRVVPLHLFIVESDPGAWVTAFQKLSAAFAPIGDAVTDEPMRFNLGGHEFVMYGRPRMVDPDTKLVASGLSSVKAAFVALDPFIYADAESSVSTGLPQFTGGLTVPLTVPFAVSARLSEGFIDITNSGTAPTPMVWRLDGPAPQPRVVVQFADGTVAQLRYPFLVPSGQYLEINTGTRTVLLNGKTDRRGYVIGEFPNLPPGTHRIRWFANEYDSDAQFTVTLTERYW